MVSWKVCLLLVAGLALGVRAAAAEESTQVGMIERNDGVAFVTGGIGDDQLAALRKLEHPDLKLVFAETGAGGHHPYVAEVRVRVLDDRGAEVLASKDAGPLLFADLPSGEYRIEATLRGRTQTKAAKVTRGKPTQVAFYW